MLPTIDPIEGFLGAWLAALSGLYLRLRDRQTKYEVNQGKLETGHEAILSAVNDIKGILNRVTGQALMGNMQASEPYHRKRGNGDE
jgi:hypothetical protein